MVSLTPAAHHGRPAVSSMQSMSLSSFRSNFGMRNVRPRRGLQALALAAVLLLHAGLASAAEAAKPAPIPVIVDNDFGTDIDDGFALSLVLASPRLKPLLVTTTYGDTQTRAQLIAQLLHDTGHADVPLAAGPAIGTREGEIGQAGWLRSPAPQVRSDGVDALLATLKRAPAGTVTLLALGPLTTVDAALKQDPQTFARLKQVILMGGSIHRGYGPQAGTNSDTPSAEYNIKLAPQALRDLLASGVKVEVQPLDSTEIALPAPLQARIFAAHTPYAAPLSALYTLWAERSPWGTTPTLFDVVPVARLLAPSVCKPVPLHITVDDDGMTRVGAGAPNATACLDVDKAGVLKLVEAALAPAAVPKQAQP